MSFSDKHSKSRHLLMLVCIGIASSNTKHSAGETEVFFKLVYSSIQVGEQLPLNNIELFMQNHTEAGKVHGWSLICVSLFFSWNIRRHSFLLSKLGRTLPFISVPAILCYYK